MTINHSIVNKRLWDGFKTFRYIKKQSMYINLEALMAKAYGEDGLFGPNLVMYA